MVLVFIFCQSVKLIPDLYEVFYCSIEPKCDSLLWIEAIIDVSHLLLAINSSCNVVIYTFSRKQFQENISDLIWKQFVKGDVITAVKLRATDTLTSCQELV